MKNSSRVWSCCLAATAVLAATTAGGARPQPPFAVDPNPSTYQPLPRADTLIALYERMADYENTGAAEINERLGAGAAAHVSEETLREIGREERVRQAIPAIRAQLEADFPDADPERLSYLANYLARGEVPSTDEVERQIEDAEDALDAPPPSRNRRRTSSGGGGGSSSPVRM